MSDASGRYTAVFNGEIYNFESLRSDLLAHGNRFRGHSDTEVLLALIAEKGIEAAIPLLWGMFAIVVWDSQERVLHLVRDRVGKKPLYYGWQGDSMVFGSELKALRAHPDFRASVDRAALTSYLRFLYVPSPLTIYEGIRKLSPAHWITIDPASPGRFPEARSYWDAARVAADGQADPLRLTDEEATDEVERLLLDAVKTRTVSDVPLGAFLSGGIDSSSVVALLQAQSADEVATFTIGYATKEYDESTHAREVAAHLGTRHTELRVSPKEARDVIPELGRLYDEPFADASQIPTFLVSQLARRTVTVALSGDGGDEVFGGYNRYLTGTAVWRRMSWVPGPLRRALASGALIVPPAEWDRVGAAVNTVLPRNRRGTLTGNNVHKLAGVLGAASSDEMYLRLVSTWPHPERVVLDAHEPRLPWDSTSAAFAEPAHRMMLLDLISYLTDDILVKVDRATMGTGLEARVPFLDHRVVEFAWRLPLHQKIRDGESKWVLRRVLERYVPRTLFERPKHGFGVPIDSWLRGPLRRWATDLLSESRIRKEGYFDPVAVQRALDDHLSGRRNVQYQLWGLLMFQSWLDHEAERNRPG